MKNKMSDLKDHLFAQLERLANKDLTPDQIEDETKRAAAIVSIADQITESSKLQLAAAKLYAEYRDTVLPFLPQIGKSE